MPDQKEPRAGKGAGRIAGRAGAFTIRPPYQSHRSFSSPNPGIPSDLFALRAAWRSLSREAEKSPDLAEGLARRRSELLAGVEAWRLPALLDALNGTEAMS